MNKFYRFVMLMALLFVVGVTVKINAAQVYLDVSAPYSNDNPSWRVWTWADGQQGYEVSGTVLSNGLIEFTVKENNFQFLRKSSDGYQEWNRTVVLSTVADATYKITGWGDSNGMTVDVTNPTYKPVYLDASAVTEDGNVWYAWSYASGGNGSWVEGALSGGKYTFEVASVKDQIIFVRMNANGAPSWDSGIKLNQTNDLTVREGGTYVITSLGTNNMEGYWKSESSNGKDLWHQDPNGDPTHYLSNRKALTGRHCMANKLINVVGVGSWIDDLNNLTDEDLENYASFPKVADVGVGVNPVTSVRDTKNHYAAGTRGGYLMVANSESSLLTLDVIKTFAVSFYLEGELQGTKAVDQNSTDVLNLSLITIPGSNEPCLELSAISDWEFDEIALMPAGGVNASVIASAKLRYAFVGDIDKNTVTYQSMNAYAEEHGREPFTLEQNGLSTNMIDDNLNNSSLLGAVLSYGGVQIEAQYSQSDPDQSQSFKKGSIVGFNYASGSLLSLDVAKTVTIKLYKGEWVQNLLGRWEFELTEVQSTTINGTVANLGLITGGRNDVNIVAQEDFSAMKLVFTGLLDLGGVVGHYAYVSDPPEVDHKCNLKLSADANVCESKAQYQLTANGGIPVTWSIDEQPDGSMAQIDATTGLLTGLDHADGTYVVRGTAADGCYDLVYVTSGLFGSSGSCDMPISNEDGEDYELSNMEYTDAGGALIEINEQLQDKENILNSSYEDYAIYQNVLNGTVVENLPIVGVKKSSGLISDGTKAHRIGFVVETQSTGLGLDAIDLFNIRTYNNGTETASKVIKEANTVKVKLIGSNRNQKLRFAVDIPAGVSFNEFVLWKSGVLDLSIDKFKIYYAFDEPIDDENEPTECVDPLGCDAKALSSDYGATLNSNEIQFAGAVNVANVIDNLSYLVDGDLSTGVSITNTVSLGTGVILAIDLGRVYTPSHQLGMVVDSKTYLARVKAGNWITMKTYLNGVEQESQSDWGVLGVNAIGYGDKSYIFMNPTKNYDEVRITIAAIADALGFDQKYYDIFVRNDYDQDGTPDCKDDDSCSEEYTLDEEATTLAKTQDYPDGNLVLHRSFDLENWNCITLPVDLTWQQVRNAFGNQVKIAIPSGFYFTPEAQAWGGSKGTVLYYEPLTQDDDDNIAMHKNQYYIIKPFREPDLTEGTYTAKDSNTVNAPVYFIPKVTYLREDEKVGGVVEPMTVNYKEVNSTSQNTTAHLNTVSQKENEPVSEENNEIILHGSQVYLDGETNAAIEPGDNYIYGDNNTLTRVANRAEKMLGFRFYAENKTPYNIYHEEEWDIPTGIVGIINNPVVKRTGIYTIDGRLIRLDNSTSGLPAGIYIVDGKKVVVMSK